MALPELNPITSPAAWLGQDMARRTAEWTSKLSDAEISEVYDLARSLRRKTEDLLQLSLADASLPLLQERLAELRKELLRGRGFAMLRGMPVEEHSLEENA